MFVQGKLIENYFSSSSYITCNLQTDSIFVLLGNQIRENRSDVKVTTNQKLINIYLSFVHFYQTRVDFVPRSYRTYSPQCIGMLCKGSCFHLRKGKVIK